MFDWYLCSGSAFDLCLSFSHCRANSSIVFKNRTGITLFPGTLNINLEEDYIVKPDWIIKPEEFGGTENVLVQKCELLGKTAYIVRAEKNQIGQGEHNLQIIEIVADICFRKKYNLTDNKKILIQIN